MKTAFVILVLIFGLTYGQEEAVSYDGDIVVSVTPKKQEHLTFLQSFRNEDGWTIDYWNDPVLVDVPVLVHLTENEMVQFIEQLTEMEFDFKVTIPDLGPYIRSEKRNKSPRWSEWEEFETLENIEAFLVEIAQNNNVNAELMSIGKSYEDRDIWLLKIDKDNGGQEKQVAFLDFNIHAREWVTSAVGTWVINQLVYNEEYSDILDKWELHIVAVLNPDGFQFTKTNDRFWRKTRSRNSGSLCRGADPNRNWDWDFAGPGTSPNPCSDTYHGESAFSEVETLAASEYMKDLDIKIYLSTHSYSQYILMPYGTGSNPDLEEMRAVGEKAEAALEAVYGTQYVTGNIQELLYPAAGGSIDWAKGRQGVRWSYAFELRDKGENGFLLPADQIIPCAEETFEAILEFLNVVYDM